MNKYLALRLRGKSFLPIRSNFFQGVNRRANNQLHNKEKISINEDRRLLPSKCFAFKSRQPLLSYSLQCRNNCFSNRKRTLNLDTFEPRETITNADTRAIRHTNARPVHRKEKTGFDLNNACLRLIDYRSNINLETGNHELII